MNPDTEEMSAAVPAECRVEDGCIVFHDGHFKIPLEDCASHEATLRCVLVLTEKTWMTRRTLGRFVSLAMENHIAPRKRRK